MTNVKVRPTNAQWHGTPIALIQSNAKLQMTRKNCRLKIKRLVIVVKYFEENLF